jgi:hypothetical protein
MPDMRHSDEGHADEEPRTGCKSRDNREAKHVSALPNVELSTLFVR